MQLLTRSLLVGCLKSSAKAGAVVAARGFAAQPLSRGDPTAAAAIQHAEALPKKVGDAVIALQAPKAARSVAVGTGGRLQRRAAPLPCAALRRLQRACYGALLSAPVPVTAAGGGHTSGHSSAHLRHRRCSLARSTAAARVLLAPPVVQLLINGEWVDAVSGKVRCCACDECDENVLRTHTHSAHIAHSTREAAAAAAALTGVPCTCLSGHSLSHSLSRFADLPRHRPAHRGGGHPRGGR